MPSLTQLEYIVAVDEYRHFGRAAEACHVSQPTLSMQIQKVEEEFKTTIFDRQKKPILPTERGTRLIAQARVTLREHRKLLDLGREGQDTLRGDFRLGVIPTLAPYLLPRFLSNFAKAFPQVNLHIDEAKTETLCREIQEDRMDAALLATPLQIMGLHEEILFYEPLSLYLSAGHPLLKKSRIEADDLDGRELWLLQDGHCFRDQVVSFCSLRGDEGMLKNVRFEAGNLETLRAIVRKSYGYTFVPQMLVETLSAAERRDHHREFRGRVPTREISLVYRRNTWKSAVMKALVQTILKTTPGAQREVNRKTHRVLEVC